jgi:hypothetical protein
MQGPRVGDPVARKLRAVGSASDVGGLEALYRGAFEEWRTALASKKLGGLVLDYDGTVCVVDDRMCLPAVSLRAEILRVVKAGLRVGFASGRGRSMYENLRSWMPRHLWTRVVLGPYSGAERLRLSEEWPSFRPGRLMEDVHQRLADSPIVDWIEIHPKPTQLTVFPRQECPFDIHGLLHVVHGLLRREPSMPVRVVSSGRAVDVMGTESSKVSVLNELENSCKQTILAIGDQGQPGGNDFELLAASRWSISVDQCSADPTRCWPVSSKRGPEALEFILSRLDIDGGRCLDLSR